MDKLFLKVDAVIISRLRKLAVPLARFSIFVIYFWFGFLKLSGVSPAEPMVYDLFEKTFGFLSFSVFFSFFAIFEMTIGVLFLLRGFERLAILLLVLHIFVSFLPLIILPETAWQTAFVPTLAGQYIIKNILLAALAVVIGSKLMPMGKP